MKRKTVQTKYDVPVRRAFRWASEQQSCSAEASMIVRIPAPWLTKEIIFVCTVFLSFTLRMTCERTLIHARSTLWIAPQNLPIYVMELTVRGWVPILGSAARNIDWRIFIDTIPRLLYTKPTSKSQINNSYDYEAFISVIILNNVSVCRFKTWYKVEDMISKFIAGSAGDSILMNNSMQGAFDLTDVFAYPLM